MLYTIDQLNFKTYISESEFSSSPLVFLKLYAPEKIFPSSRIILSLYKICTSLIT